jgi:hypothetical protein
MTLLLSAKKVTHRNILQTSRRELLHKKRHLIQLLRRNYNTKATYR